jgi:hypothetical protein
MAELHNDRHVLGVRILGDGEGGSDPTGAVDDAAYSDATGAADGSVIALLKGIYVQNAAMIALLDDIKTNTTA